MSDDALCVCPPGMSRNSLTPGVEADFCPQTGVRRQSTDSIGQFGDGAWRDQQSRLAMLENLTDLSETAGDNSPGHRHVLEQFCRRSEELTAVRIGNVWRSEHIAGSKISRTIRLVNPAGEDHM